MWYKVNELHSKGLNKSQISVELGIYRSTASHAMNNTAINARIVFLIVFIVSVYLCFRYKNIHLNYLLQLKSINSIKVSIYTRKF